METRVLSIDDFWTGYQGQPFELIDGDVVEMPPTGIEHGAVTRRVGARLGDFVDARQLGEVVGGEVGFRLDDTTLRAADCAFISREKMARLTNPEKYAPFAPDLAVEVVSPNDAAQDIQAKVEQYLAAGTALVWIIYPSLRRVIVHTPDGHSTSYNESDTLDGGSVLPGLALPVASLFAIPPVE